MLKMAGIFRKGCAAVFIGIDGGNTKTSYVAARPDGHVLAYLIGPGSNYQVLGSEETGRRLFRGYQALLNSSEEKPRGVFIGAAGADTDADRVVLAELFARVFPGVPRDFDNDGLVALKNGVENHEGLVVTWGTGNTNFAIDRQGQIRRIGGLIEPLGDALGSYAVAKVVTSTAARAQDGRDFPSVLPRLLSEAFGVTRVADLIHHPWDNDFVTCVLKVLFQAAELGDGRALQIVWECVQEVLRITDRFAVELFRDGRYFRLVLDGAVFRGGYEVCLTMIRLAVEARYNAEIIIPSTPPVAGALYLAYEREGIPLTAELLDKVKRSFPEEAVPLEN